jgi:ribosomal protein S9
MPLARSAANSAVVPVAGAGVAGVAGAAHTSMTRAIVAGDMVVFLSFLVLGSSFLVLGSWFEIEANRGLSMPVDQ